jgi:ABC-type sugar transport system substrate-binding protein
MQNDFCRFAAGITESYDKRSGVKYTIHDSDMDVQKQLGIVEDLIAMQPDAFFLWPVDADVVVPLVERAMAEGIDVYNSTIPIPLDDVASCQHRNYDQGRAGGEHAVELAMRTNTKLKVLIIYGLLTEGENAKERGRGFTEAAEASGGWVEAIDGPDCGWTDAPATDAIMDIFPAHPEYNGVYEMGSMCHGVVQGLKAVDRLYPVGDPEHVYMMANDDNQNVIQYIEDKQIDGSVAHGPYRDIDTTYKQFLMRTTLGKSIPMHVDVPVEVLVTEDIGTQSWDMSWGVILRDIIGGKMTYDDIGIPGFGGTPDFGLIDFQR